MHPTGLVKPDDADAKIKFLAAEARFPQLECRLNHWTLCLHKAECRLDEEHVGRLFVEWAASSSTRTASAFATSSAADDSGLGVGSG